MIKQKGFMLLVLFYILYTGVVFFADSTLGSTFFADKLKFAILTSQILCPTDVHVCKYKRIVPYGWKHELEENNTILLD